MQARTSQRVSSARLASLMRGGRKKRSLRLLDARFFEREPGIWAYRSMSRPNPVNVSDAFRAARVFPAPRLMW
jgi:hypothetical protein